MNQAFFEYAMSIIENLTDEEIYEGLKNAGMDMTGVTLRQYPEPEKKDEE